MKCPHCNTSIADAFTAPLNFWTTQEVFTRDGKFLAHAANWSATAQRCPECHEQILFLKRAYAARIEHPGTQHAKIINPPAPPLEFMAHPNGNSRPIPPEVTSPYREDFAEACAVLQPSPKASAALSRRLLQAILRDKAGTKAKDLYEQIEEIIAAGRTPDYVTEALHAVRHTGNIAAHSLKSTVTGAVVDVEPHEAEWNLDTIETLFEYYFVRPAINAKRKADLNAKLAALGKPPI